MAITLGKKSMEVERVFNSLGGVVYKPLKVTISATETPKETIINVHVTIQLDYTPLWRRIVEKCKRILSKFNSHHDKSDG